MNSIQRILRRLHLMDSMPLMLRESRYHRDNDEEEDLPSVVLWKWDEEEGEVVVWTLEDDNS